MDATRAAHERFHPGQRHGDICGLFERCLADDSERIERGREHVRGTRQLRLGKLAALFFLDAPRAERFHVVLYRSIWRPTASSTPRVEVSLARRSAPPCRHLRNDIAASLARP